MDTHGSVDEQMDTLPLPNMYEGDLDPVTSRDGQYIDINIYRHILTAHDNCIVVLWLSSYRLHIISGAFT